MKIVGLSILPPLAVGRLGASAHPLENYELETPADGIGFRRIAPAETLYVDEASGAIARAETPRQLHFRDGEQIRPVAPFLEVFAHLENGDLVPLSLDRLGVKRSEDIDLRWRVDVANIKAFRRTGDAGDKATASVEFSDHAQHALRASAGNFLPNKILPLGHVRYIRPTDGVPANSPALHAGQGAGLRRAHDAQETRRLRQCRRGADQILARTITIIYDPPSPGWAGPTRGRRPPTPGRSTPASPTPRGAGKLGLSRRRMRRHRHRRADARRRATRCRPSPASAPGRRASRPTGFPCAPSTTNCCRRCLGPAVDPRRRRCDDAEDIVRRARRDRAADEHGGDERQHRQRPWRHRQHDGGAGRQRHASVLRAGRSAQRHRRQPRHARLHQAALAALRAGTAPWFPDVLRSRRRSATSAMPVAARCRR